MTLRSKNLVNELQNMDISPSLKTKLEQVSHTIVYHGRHYHLKLSDRKITGYCWKAHRMYFIKKEADGAEGKFKVYTDSGSNRECEATGEEIEGPVFNQDIYDLNLKTWQNKRDIKNNTVNKLRAELNKNHAKELRSLVCSLKA